MTTHTPQEEIVARAQADWVHFPEAHWLVHKWASGRGLDTRQELVRVLRSLISQGLVQVGTVRGEDGFVPWGIDETATIQRILEEWDVLGRAPVPGDVCWLANTPAGDALAEDLLSRPDPNKRWISDR